jgi:hypothetical protein
MRRSGLQKSRSVGPARSQNPVGRFASHSAIQPQVTLISLDPRRIAYRVDRLPSVSYIVDTWQHFERLERLEIASSALPCA